LANYQGEPILLPPGLHQWNDPNLSFDRFIDLSSSLIQMGPYTLVTVEECYAAITQDNGKQKVLAGGSSYMLTHQNWKFQSWLSLKMQTNRLGPLDVTTGDNIALKIVANVNWVVSDAVTAAGKNVDSSLGDDTLRLMRNDVNLQVVSSLASLLGRIQYGTHGTKGAHKVTAKPDSMQDTAEEAAGEHGQLNDLEPESEEKLSRKALWDPNRLQSAVRDANNICNRYGVEILSINLISAAPADRQLVEIMSRGAVATVSAEERTKAAMAEANSTLIVAQAEAAKAEAAAQAKLIEAKAEADALAIAVQGEATRAQAAADAMLVRANAEAQAERAKAEGNRDAGLLMAESEVAVQLAKLRIAYGPFAENQSSTFFFGLQGPGELPTALLGQHLAAQTGTTGLALAAAGRAQD